MFQNVPQLSTMILGVIECFSRLIPNISECSIQCRGIISSELEYFRNILMTKLIKNI